MGNGTRQAGQFDAADYDRIEYALGAPIDGVPGRFKLLPWGQVHSTRGDFLVDDEAAAAIVAEFTDNKIDKVVDFEHTTVGGEHKRADGKSPAAGWIKGFEPVSGDGLYALTDWTPEGRAALESKSYRYHSPVVIVRKADRRAVRIHSVALTNTPALRGIEAIVNADNGLGVLVPDGVCEVLGLTDDTPADEVVETVRKLKAHSEELVTLKQKLAETEADQIILKAQKDRKLAPYMKPWAKGFILKDRAGFEEWLAVAPVVMPPDGRTNPPPSAPSGGGRLAIINKAAREFQDAGGEDRLLCSLAGFINATLADQKQSPMTSEESARFITVKA